MQDESVNSTFDFPIALKLWTTIAINVCNLEELSNVKALPIGSFLRKCEIRTIEVFCEV